LRVWLSPSKKKVLSVAKGEIKIELYFSRFDGDQKGFLMLSQN